MKMLIAIALLLAAAAGLGTFLALGAIALWDGQLYAGGGCWCGAALFAFALIYAVRFAEDVAAECGRKFNR